MPQLSHFFVDKTDKSVRTYVYANIIIFLNAGLKKSPKEILFFAFDKNFPRLITHVVFLSKITSAVGVVWRRSLSQPFKLESGYRQVRSFRVASNKRKQGSASQLCIRFNFCVNFRNQWPYFSHFHLISLVDWKCCKILELFNFPTNLNFRICGI